MTSAEGPAVLVRGLTRRFGERAAVHDLSFEIARGEIVALLGPDGAGKTTTLRLLCGAIQPTSGTIIIAGIDLTRDPEQVRAHLGYMPQRFSLYGDLTVQENLNFYADLYAVSRAARETFPRAVR
ncbi:MAG TPA: ATP-binding cassette domain-containing protein [bacterium]|nr:ATP-binding cassette domain-containing protein [bacterium]